LLPYDEIDLYYIKEALVCLFNGDVEPWMYDELSHHLYP
jgi:hypothetical protein